MKLNRWQIIPWQDGELEPALNVWRKSSSDRGYDFGMDRTAFRERILDNPCFDPNGALVAKVVVKNFNSYCFLSS
jgi:hypothetical protein